MNSISILWSFLFVLFFLVPYGSVAQSKNGASQLEEVEVPARLYFDEVVNKQNIKTPNEIFSSHYVFHEMNGEESRHMKNNTLVPHLNYSSKAFPDLHYSIDHIISEGNKVAIYTTATGTHKDEFLGFSPTGKRVTYKHMLLSQVLNGKIIEGWGVVDVAGARDQLSK